MHKVNKINKNQKRAKKLITKKNNNNKWVFIFIHSYFVMWNKLY